MTKVCVKCRKKYLTIGQGATRPEMMWTCDSYKSLGKGFTFNNFSFLEGSCNGFVANDLTIPELYYNYYWKMGLLATVPLVLLFICAIGG